MTLMRVSMMRGFFVTNEPTNQRTNEPTDKAILGVGCMHHACTHDASTHDTCKHHACTHDAGTNEACIHDACKNPSLIHAS